MLEHRIAVALDMVAVADAPVLAPTPVVIGQQRVQRLLARHQRRFAQVAAVEVEQVESIIEHVAAAALQRLDQHGEARDAGRRLDQDLAVDDRELGGDVGESLRNAGKALRPVEPLPAEQLYAAVLEVSLQAVAVVLDLVQPAGTRRRRLRRRREAGLDVARHRRRLRFGDLGGIDRRLASALLRFGLGDFTLAGRPHPVLLARDRLDAAAGRSRVRPLREDVRRIGRPRRLVVRLEQQPVLVLLARLRAQAHEMPLAFQLLAVQLELQMAFLEAESRIELGRPRAFVPDHDRAAAVLALRDDALEAAIVERMVLGRHRQPLLAGDQARPLRHRPALQHAVHLQPEVIVQPPRRMLLDDIGIAASARRRLARRLRRPREIALGIIGVERLGHGDTVARCGGS